MAKDRQLTQEPEEELSSGDSLKLDLYFWLQALVMALVTLILLFTFVGRIIGVDGSSMYPTLHDRDMLLLQSVGYTPRQGDVVVLTKAFRDVDGPIVKRVIAVGGQTVDIDYAAGTVSVDGEVLDEPYINEAMLPPSYANQTHIEVPEGSIFVMGDNRNHSSDSRDVALGVIDERYVLGRAVCVLLPFQHFGLIPEGEQTA
ncbi:signal peptidase I [Flavonifractor sp. CLA-AP-H34]|uniref:Signal peptidase I n=1 Tax=Flavonifractor hominis TaxID=3133178 RepID=A0ABV1ER32_9FIRM